MRQLLANFAGRPRDGQPFPWAECSRFPHASGREVPVVLPLPADCHMAPNHSLITLFKPEEAINPHISKLSDSQSGWVEHGWDYTNDGRTGREGIGRVSLEVGLCKMSGNRMEVGGGGQGGTQGGCSPAPLPLFLD